MTILRHIIELGVMALVLGAVGLVLLVRWDTAPMRRAESERKALALAATQRHAGLAGKQPAGILAGRVWAPGEIRQARVTGRDGSDA